MPISTSNITDMLSLLNYLNSICYKDLIINFSYIYYITIFFLLTRILIYFGVSFINLVNSKHTTCVKNHSVRVLFTFFMKFYQKNSTKQTLLKLTTITCL